MKAATYESYGSPEVVHLEEVPTPQPGDDDVLVRVDTTTVNLVDCAFRAGDPIFARLFTGLRRPRRSILGSELAGEVVAAGRNVTRFRPGDLVFGAADENFGTHAQYVRLPANGVLTTKPEGLTMAEAAGATGGVLTALPFLRDHARVQPGQRVLIVGASGSIGTAAVQLAKRFGAHVTGVCSGGNAAMVGDLGADEVVDYTVDDFTRGSERYDVVFDTVGKSSPSAAKRVLVDGGVYMTTVISLGALWRNVWTRVFGRHRAIFAATGLRAMEDKRKDLLVVRELLAKGELRMVVDRTMPLSDIVEAHRYVGTGHKKGNLVIAVDHAA